MFAKAISCIVIVCVVQVLLCSGGCLNNGLTVNMLVTGQDIQARPILQGKIVQPKLDQFLESLSKMKVSGSDEFLEGHFEMLSRILAAKSTTSESDWLLIANGNRSLLTPEELNEIPVGTTKSNAIRTLFRTRLAEPDGTPLVNIMNTLHRTKSQQERYDALYEYFVTALMVASNQPRTEVECWFTPTFVWN